MTEDGNRNHSPLGNDIIRALAAAARELGNKGFA